MEKTESRFIRKTLRKIKAKDMATIILGTFLMGVAINFVFDPMQLDVGGVSGLAVVVKYASAGIFSHTQGFLKEGIPVWLTTVILNVPLFAAAIKVKGWRYIARTLFATVSLTAWLYVLPVKAVLEDPLLATLFGGVLSGVGMGLVFLAMATTGGSDLLATLLHSKWRHLSVPMFLSIVDGVVVALGLVQFGLSNVIYSIVVVFLVAKISDAILEGLKFAKMAFIISDRTEDIAKEILTDMDRGATGIKVKGMYSGQDKNMLFCVVSKKQLPELQDIVSGYDKKAFMVIADAREVMGEGFAEVKNTN